MAAMDKMGDSVALTDSRDNLYSGRSWSGDNAKRIIDLVVACALIVFTLPLMAIVALAIKCDSPGSVFYRQERVGLGGCRFILLKFRSMVENAESDGQPVWAAQRDVRTTAVGRLIRLMRIDELPQLFNVLCGDMSMVGPRPERPYFVEQLTEVIPLFAERQKIKPGITAWAQINYPYGASIEDARNKLIYDLYYLKNRSLVLDLMVLMATVRVVIFQQGAR
jgi:lipopolysaccharide/colanic/teichoic acid biosynthesis glycosyltransferase